MLFKETVTNSTYNILKQICALNEFADFDLVGGTSLSLQIGHRISVDIDLFTVSHFNTKDIKACLLENFITNTISFDYESKNTLIGSIDQIKFDFIRHAYPTIKEGNIIDGIRLSSLEDIAAMKVGAITDNGTRIKDFVDLYFLLQRFSLKQIIQFYSQKYSSENSFHALKSITYFNDLDKNSIEFINFMESKQISFKQLKEKLTKDAEHFVKSNI